MAAPELRLNVSLDLGFFRQQLRQLSTVASNEFNAPLKVKLDRSALNNEVRLLNKYFSNKTFNVRINTNLESEIDAANRLVKALGRVQQAATGAKSGLPIGTGAFGKTKPKGGFSAAEIKTLFNAAIQGGLLDEKTLGKTRDQMVAGLGSIAKDAIAGLLNGLNSSNADIKRAAESIGNTLIATTKKNLGIASPSKKFEEIGKNVGEGFEKGALSSMDNAFDALERKMRQRGKILDTVARGIFRMLGMDPAAMLQEARQKRLPPAINWQATVPRLPIGPSSTGRALPPGPERPLLSESRLAGFLPGRPSAASILELNNILAGAIREYFKAVASQIKPPTGVRGGQPLLGGAKNPLLLPPAGGTTPAGATRFNVVSTGAYLGQPGFMRAPSVPPSMGGGGGGMPPGGGTGGGPGNFANRGGGFGGGFNMPALPGAGLVRGIGEEFAFAAKQVLLYGQAYKLLAIAQNFPAQVGAAVGALQSFRNTINEISPSAKEAADSSQFILDIVDKYNVPLQSARDGFVKLYASMQPAGFSGNEIRDLFLGISQTAATFGMSAEKVDRVNYAFAQMASKGQVMSEELKGQLGDVLPGAMAIFAEAAGFEGPEALKKFSKALEDGAYKGSTMKTLLTNVGIIMRKEFGPGAEGAARTFQGVMNRMQNSMKLLYESFEPVAVGFLNTIVMPMTSGIKTLTDGFNAFFKGQAAQTIGGSAVAEQLNSLKPAFEGILANIKSLIPSFQIFGGVIFNAAKLLLALAGNPVVGFLFNVYTNVLLLNTAFTLLGGKILLGVIASVNATITRMVALGFAINALGVQTMGAKTALAGTQLQMLLLQRSAAGMVGPLTLSNVAMAVLAAKAALVVGGLVLLGKGVYDTNETFRNFVNNIGGVVASDFRNAVDGMAKDAGSAADDIQESYKNLTAKLNPIGEYIKQLFKDVFKSTSDSAQDSAAQSTNAFNDFFNSLSSNATAGFNGLSAVISNWWSNLPAPIRRIFEGNALSMLVGAAQYVGDAASRASAPNAQATGMYGRYAPGSAQKPFFSPRGSGGGTTVPLPVVGGGAGGGSGGGAGSKDKNKSKAAELKLELKYNQELMALEAQIFNAQLGKNNLLAVRLDGEKDLLKLRYEALKVNLEEIPPEDKKLKIATLNQQADIARLKTRAAMEAEVSKVVNEQQRVVEDLQAASQLELDNKKQYANLLKNGIAPEQAKIVIEVDNEIKKVKEVLELTRKQVKAEIDKLELMKAQGKVIDEQLLGTLKDKYRTTGENLEALPGIATEETAKKFALNVPKTATEYVAEGLAQARKNLEELMNIGNQVVGAANAIGSAFGEAFKGIASGSMTALQALSSFFQSVGDYFIDMAARMIAEWLKIQLIQGLANFIGGIFGGGGFGGAVSGTSAGGLAGSSLEGGFASPLVGAYAGANGGIAPGGWKPFPMTAFANGGMVTGPTMGLVGEGRYNEAIVPLPNGKSIPVELGGAAGNQINSNITVNVNNGQAQSNATGSNSSELGRKIEGAVKQVIVGELRPGGLLASR